MSKKGKGLCTLYKPHRQVKGEGVAQMSTLLNKSYLVKVTTKGGGGSKMPQILSTWFVHSPFCITLSVFIKFMGTVTGYFSVEQKFSSQGFFKMNFM